MSTSEGKPYVESGDFRALAVFGSARNVAFPDVPTFAELGYPYEFNQSFGIWAPKDTPDEIVAYLVEAAQKASEDPEFVSTMEKQGLAAVHLNAEEYTQALEKAFAECDSVSSLLKK